MDTLLTFAQKMLDKNGEYYPFGASMDKKEEIAIVSGKTENDHPESNELIDIIKNGLINAVKKDEVIAVGICFDVRIALPGNNEKSDAVQIDLEHIDGQSISVYMPYKKRIMRSIKYGDLIAVKKDKSIFMAT
jgi:hypothetical protein